MSAPAAARVRLMRDGHVRVQIAGHEIGTGAYTVIGQMAAERLGVPLDEVTRRARRQRSAAGAGRRRLQHHREHLLGRDEGLRRDPQRLSRPRRRRRRWPTRPAAELGRRWRPTARRAARGQRSSARRRRDRGICRVRAARAPSRTPSSSSMHGQARMIGGGSKGKKLMYAFGAEFVEVRVNARDARNPRAAHRRRLRRRPHHEPAHRAQPAMGGMIWGMSLGAARGDRDRPAQRALRQRQSRRLSGPGERRHRRASR